MAQKSSLGDLSPDRIIGFSDAIFAFAVTLLALNIDVPENLPSAQLVPTIMALGPHILNYAISFVVIASFWVHHHRIFRHIKRYDTTLIWTNLVLLMAMTFMPFLTDFVSDYDGNPLPVVIYALSLGVSCMLLELLWFHAASNRRLIDESVPDEVIKSNSFRALGVAAVFFLSAPVAFFSIQLSQLMWASAFFILFILSRISPERSPQQW